MLLLRWCPFQIQNEKWLGLQFTRTDYLSLVLTPLRIRWTIPLTIFLYSYIVLRNFFHCLLIFVWVREHSAFYFVGSVFVPFPSPYWDPSIHSSLTLMFSILTLPAFHSVLLSLDTIHSVCSITLYCGTFARKWGCALLFGLLLFCMWNKLLTSNVLFLLTFCSLLR
jgi:hypothetical protein